MTSAASPRAENAPQHPSPKKHAPTSPGPKPPGSLPSVPPSRELPHPGPPRRVKVWGPVVISLIVQVPVSVLVLLHVVNGGSGAIGVTERVDSFDGLPYGLTIAFAALGLVLAIGSALALLAVRRHPRVVVVGIVVAAAVVVFLWPVGPPFIAVAFAVVMAVRRGERLWAYVSLAAAWMLVLFFGPLAGTAMHPRLVPPVTLALLLTVGAAEFGKRRSDQRQALVAEHEARLVAEREREASAQQEERMRIARDLHDVLGHSLSQITVQANAGLHLADRDPDAAREALANVKATSTRALAEVRGVLGLLRDGSPTASPPASPAASPATAPPADPDAAPRTPAPSVEQLDDLVGLVRRNGLDVALSVSAVDDLPVRVGQSVYRIVQESLTNVVRHGRSRRVRVAVARDTDAVTIEIENAGPDREGPVERGHVERGPVERGHDERGHDERGFAVRGSGAADASAAASHPPVQPGNGLLGMRERAELVGGTFHAGPTASGGWLVHAVIPIGDTP